MIRHPEIYAEVRDELDELYADGQEVSFHALRQIPKLDNVVKETLRLHPPLIILMRVAQGEFEVAGFPIHRDIKIISMSDHLAPSGAEGDPFGEPALA